MRRAIRLLLLRSSSSSLSSLLPSKTPSSIARFCCSSSSSFSSSSSSSLQSEVDDAASVFRRWGCSDDDVSTIFKRHPLIGKMDTSYLQSKLNFLRGIGFRDDDVSRIVTCRPRLLSLSFDRLVGVSHRVEFLGTLLASKSLAFQIILRNPSLLIYDIDRMRRTAELYERMGVSRKDLGALLRLRPTILSRSNIDGEEKTEFIRRTGVPKEGKMYKHVVSVIAISRLETIREKINNLEKFGLSVDEVWRLVGRSPNILTFSTDKVQRHMTFIIATMNLPANSVVRCPSLLEINLDKVLKPRFFLLSKHQEMDLYPKLKTPGHTVQRIMRMRESRFLKVFVECHEKNVAMDLMEFYNKMKGLRRLAEESKLGYNGFPF